MIYVMHVHEEDTVPVGAFSSISKATVALNEMHEGTGQLEFQSSGDGFWTAKFVKANRIPSHIAYTLVEYTVDG